MSNSPSNVRSHSANDAEMPRLRFLDGSLMGVELTVDHDVVLLGRFDDCGIVLDAKQDELVSGHHARVFREGRDWFIEDLNSTNGTWQNGQRLQGRQRLEPDDEVVLGVPGKPGSASFSFVSLAHRKSGMLRRSGVFMPDALVSTMQSAKASPPAPYAAGTIVEAPTRGPSLPSSVVACASAPPGPVPRPTSDVVATSAAAPASCCWCGGDSFYGSRELAGTDASERVCRRCKLVQPGGYAWDDPRWQTPWLASTSEAFWSQARNRSSRVDPNEPSLRDGAGLAPDRLGLGGMAFRWVARLLLAVQERRRAELAANLHLAAAYARVAGNAMLAQSGNWPDALRAMGLPDDQINIVDAPFWMAQFERQRQAHDRDAGRPAPIAFSGERLKFEQAMTRVQNAARRIEVHEMAMHQLHRLL